MIWGVTTLLTILAIAYVLLATQWWEARASIEIGKKWVDKDSEAIYLENGNSVRARLQIKYIDIYNKAKNRESFIETISSAKTSPQYITITALSKDNTGAISEVKKVIDDVVSEHAVIIKEITQKKQSELDEINRAISKLKNNTITEVSESINYIKKTQLPSIDKTIAEVTLDLEKSKKQRDEAFKNLTALTKNASLSALRLSSIQGLEYKISANKIKLIELEDKKQSIITTLLPLKERELERLKNEELGSLQTKRDLILLSMQSHNYYNTAIVGNIVTQDKPVKPKKTLIVVVAFITGLMLSIFLAFFLEFVSGVKKEEY